MAETDEFSYEIKRLKERYESGQQPYNDRHERPTEPFTPIKKTAQPTLEEKVNALREHDPNLSPQGAIRQVTPDSPRPIPYSKPSLTEALRTTFNNFFRGSKK